MITFMKYQEEFLDHPDEFVLSNSNWYEDLAPDFAVEWCRDPEVQRLVKIVDQTDWVVDDIFNSPWLGKIPSTQLSGGVKGLILMLKATDVEKTQMPRVFMDWLFGDNCLDLLLEIGTKCDFTFCLDGSVPWRVCKNPIVGKTLSGKPVSGIEDLYRIIDGELS